MSSSNVYFYISCVFMDYYVTFSRYTNIDSADSNIISEY